MKPKALFLDRDGVIVQMHYDMIHGTIDTPRTLAQVVLVPHLIPFLQTAQKLGYTLIVISNQPNIAIKKMSATMLQRIEKKIVNELEKNGIIFAQTYYCFHHPFSKIKKYKKLCQCRKPGTLLMEKAIKDFSIDTKKSWFIGDSIFDIVMGNKMKVKTLLLARIHEAEYLHVLEEQLGKIKPTRLVKNLEEARNVLLTQAL